MADIKWIKLSTDIWNNKKIKQIESFKNGDTLIVIWLKLLTLAGNINDNGYIYLTPEIPYTDKGLATELNKSLKNTKEAIALFEEYGMIEIENGYIILTGWEKYQNVDGMEKIREQNRERKRKQRNRDKSQNCHVTGHTDVTEGHDTDKDIDIDIEKEIERECIEREYNSLSIPPSIDELWEFLPKAQEILEEQGMSLNFDMSELEPFYARNTQYKWKGITDAESMAMAMYMWTIRADDYKMAKENK